MAAIGDILVKFVADFADFAAGLEKGQKQLVDFGAQATETGKAVQGFIGAAKAVFSAAIVTEAIAGLKAFADQTIKSAIEIDNLAQKYKLTTDQVQGLQAQAKATGEDFNKLADYYKNHSDQLGKITDAAKTTAQVMSSDLVKAIGNFADAADDAFVKAKWMFTSGGSGPANAINAAAGAVKNLGDSLAYIDGKQAAMAFVIAVATGNFGQIAGGIIGAATNTAGTATTAAADKQLADANANLEKVREMVAQGTLVAKDLEKAEQDVVIAADNLRNARDKARLVQQQDAKLQGAKDTLKLDPITVTGTGGGGAGGRTDDDNIQAQIDRYAKLTAASKTAYDTIQGGANATIEALKRQITVQEQIDTIAAKLGARYTDADQALKDQLKDQLTAYAQQRDATQKALEVVQAAVETDKKYGDGKVALTKLQKDLNDQLKTGRINQDDYNRATKEGVEAIQQSALAAQRYDDNLGSLAAGFEHAANAYSRQNDLYSLGEQSFNALTSSMMEGLKALEGQSQKSFGQIAADFANMLAQMALQAAASAAFKALFGAVSAAAAPTIAGAGLPGAAGFDTFLTTPGARAGGGPVGAGQPYVVGEQGPELFVPSAAGNIVPNSQTSGAGSVTVNVDMSGNSGGTSNPSQALEFGRRVKAAVVGVIQNEQRPGGTLYQRRS